MVVSPKTIIKLKDLGSRITAKTIAPRGKTLDASSIKSGNLAKGFLDWLGDKIGGFIRSINFKKIWEWVVNGFTFLYNFNWQQTDEEINEQIKQTWLSVEQRMFGILGRSLGYLVCGAVPGALVATFNAPMAAFLMKELGEEFIDDMLGELGAFFQMAGRAAMQSMFLKAFSSVRNLIKKANKIPGIRQALGKLGVSNTAIDNWGEEKGKKWSFASAVEERIENIKNERLRENIEEFMEEFGDACIEAGYVIANGLDEYLGLDGVNKGVTDLFGKERAVAFTPNDKVPDESFLLRGRTEFIKNQMNQIMNNSQLIDNRDIGLLLPGNGDFDEIPVTGNNGIEVTFEFINFEEPPYWTKERRKQVKRARFTVPNCERSKLTWENIYMTLSESNASNSKSIFSKGNIRSECHISNGKKLVVYTATESEGEDLLEKLAKFTSYKLVYPIDVRTHRGVSKRTGYNLTTIPTRMYLMSIVVCNWEKLTKFEQQKGILPVTTDRKNQTVKLKMHYDFKPAWWDERLREALTGTVSN